MNTNDAIKKIDNLERIGVIGSPSSNSEIKVDILEAACKKNLVGSFTIFKFMQENVDHFALGQITEILLRNTWTEDPTIKGIIRHRGPVNPISGRQDTHIASMLTSSIFQKEANGFGPSSIGTVPETGTPIKLVNDEILDGLLSDLKDELFYLGRIYGSEPKLPTWFKHFGEGKGGLNEAYHIGIFGKTGSGKSFLAKMMISGYARHRNMSIFIIDPQGEFTKDCVNEGKLKKIIVDKLGRKLKLYNLHNLVLSGSELFKEVLMRSDYLFELGIRNEPNRETAAKIINKFLKQLNIPPYKCDLKENYDKVHNLLSDEKIIKKIYTTDKNGQNRVAEALEEDKEDLERKWMEVARLFSYKESENVTIKKIVEGSLSEQEKDIIVIDLSGKDIPDNILWNEEISHVVINELLKRLTVQAEEAYKKDRHLNSLFVIDEAHKLAPKEMAEAPESLKKIKNTLIHAVRTTRKCGLGWMFISQTLASLDREIINQIRVFSFGFGLGWGVERDSLKQIIGGNDKALSLYQSFKDPQSGFKTKDYPFMVLGPISPLSFSSTPMFLNALNFPDEFSEINNLK